MFMFMLSNTTMFVALPMCILLGICHVQCQNTVSAMRDGRLYGLIAISAIDVGVKDFLFGFYLMLLFL